MSKSENIVLIVNARSRKSKDWRAQIEPICQELAINISTSYYVDDRESFQRAIADIRKNPPDLVIVGGGDGTIHSVINHIDMDATTLAVLPLGTANNFARSLGLRREVKSSLQAIANRKTKLINLGTINGHYFTNLAAIGVSASVAQNVSDKSKRFIGRLAYYVQGIYEIAIHKPFLCEINIDDGETKIFYTHQIVIANGQYHGPIRFTPGANIDAGDLTLIIFGRDKRRLVHLKNIIYFIIPGWLKAQPLASKAKTISLRTKPTRAVEVDGEAVSQTPAEFKIKQDCLKVVYSPKAN